MPKLFNSLSLKKVYTCINFLAHTFYIKFWVLKYYFVFHYHIINVMFSDINECIEFVGICQNGGFCINTLGGYTCRCTEQWEGANCTIDVDECKMQVCKNGATCVNTPGGFTCTCPPGWQGNMCEQGERPCAIEVELVDKLMKRNSCS